MKSLSMPRTLPPALIALATALAAPLTAQEPDEPYLQIANEYFLTKAVYPQEAREIQFTVLPSIDFEDGTASLLPLAIEYGITDRLQLEASWDAWGRLDPDGLPSTTGSGDVEIEAQYSFMNLGGSRTHLAVGFGVTFPAGDESDGVSEGTREFEPSVVLARDVTFGGRAAQLFAQGAVGFVEDDAGDDPKESADELLFGGGVAVAFGAARLILEAAWTSSEWDGGDESAAQLSSGLVWDLPGTWEAGIATRFGIGGEAADVGLSFILLHEFEIGGDDD